MQDRESGDFITTVPIAGIPQLKNGSSVDLAPPLSLMTSSPRRLTGAHWCNKEFNGSSLEIQGANEILRRFREVSVASGTGKLRFTRGYAIFDNYFVDMKALNAVLRWNFTVLHY
ncbi:Dirigent protein [Dillenia turbinata]|uniref:Dirigent protein n=1 Tax=Dillenia turbinata TaxID=194707 RepID=A0AAN8YXJ5_9MAGN